MYARNVEERTLTFGVSGKLIMNALVMYDHQTQSLWSQFLGQAVSGPFAGTKLRFIPALMTHWATWVELHPDTKALDKQGRSAFDPYLSYYANNRAGILGEAVSDDRLSTKEFVIGVENDGQARAYPYRQLNRTPLLNDTFQDVPILVVLDTESGTGVVFRREVENQVHNFDVVEAQTGQPLLMVDRETGSRWVALTGEAVEGPLDGAVLKRFRSHLSFWFAWTDFYPDTQVYGE